MAPKAGLILAFFACCTPLVAFPVRRVTTRLRLSAEDSFATVEAEVQEYLRKRESALGDDDDCLSPLDPTELQRFGYGRLVGKFMDFGGYIAVSRRLGVPVSPPRPDEVIPDLTEKPDEKVPWILEQQTSPGALAMGQALEERLAQAQKLSDPEERARIAMRMQQGAVERSQTELEPAAARRKRRSKLNLSPQGVWTPDEEDTVTLQPFTLSLLERSSIVLALGCWALVHGRATSEVIELGLNPNAIEVARFVGRGMAAASVFGGVGCGILAKDKNRSVPLWVIKGLMCGAAAVLEIRNADVLPVVEEKGDEAEE